MSPATKTSPCRPPDLEGGARHRRSKSSRWRALALVLVHLAIAAHIAHWLSTGRGETLSPLEPSEGERFARESIVNTGLVFFALTILSTLVLGRWFCGWACHVVALQDACRWLLLKVGITPRPLRSRWLTIVPLLTALYIFVWPVVPRLLAGESLAYQGAEFTRSGFWDTFATWVPALVTLFVCGGLAVYFLGAKGFCTYGCPYGAFFVLADKVAPGRIRVTDDCKSCGHCTLVCSSNVDVSREVHEYGMVVDPGCMKCLDCVSVCPEDALYFGFGKPALGAKRRNAPRARRKAMPFGEELFVVAVAAFAYVGMRGFNEASGLLLSVGVAVCVAGLALLVLRMFRRDDVALPGLALKSAGKVRPAGHAALALLLAGSVLAVPYGVVPELAAQRAKAAFVALEPTRGDWLQRADSFGLADVPAGERARAGRMERSAERVRERAWVRTQRTALHLAWARLLAGDRSGALPFLEETLVYGKEHPILWTLLGDAHARPDGEVGAPAVAAYERALELDAGYAPAAARLAEVYRRRAVSEPSDPGAVRAALAVLDRTIAANPSALALRGQRGLFRLALGDAAGAEADLAAVVAGEPAQVEARLALATVLAEAGRVDEALELAAAAPESVRQDPRLAELTAALRAMARRPRD